jgi:hypothetical protein
MEGLKMIKKMKLGTKIGAGFGVSIVIAAILGFVGWNGVNHVRTFMAEYASWGNIDMVMNEGVSQNVLKLVNKMYIYETRPNEKNFKTLQDTLAEADRGLEEWHSLVKDYPKLEAVAISTKENISMTRQLIDQYSNALKTTTEIKSEWDNLVNRCLSHLETTMEEVIDPAKAKAEQAENVRNAAFASVESPAFHTDSWFTSHLSSQKSPQQ